MNRIKAKFLFLPKIQLLPSGGQNFPSFIPTAESCRKLHIQKVVYTFLPSIFMKWLSLDVKQQISVLQKFKKQATSTFITILYDTVLNKAFWLLVLNPTRQTTCNLIYHAVICSK